MYKDKKYSVYLTDEEDEILHELVTARALVGEKAYYSALFAEGIRMLHEDTCIDTESLILAHESAFYETLENEVDRLSELETIVWIDFYGEKEVIDNTKLYKFRDDIHEIKKENKKLKDDNKDLKEMILSKQKELKDEITKFKKELKNQ